MAKTLTVVTPEGSVSITAIMKLIFLLLLGSLSLVTALAVNELVQKFLEQCNIRKNNLTGYAIYTLIALILLISVAYIGCMVSPELVEYINVSPL